MMLHPASARIGDAALPSPEWSTPETDTLSRCARPSPAEGDGDRAAAPKAQAAASNGRRAVDFVCEDDVRRAIQKGEKIYVNARTIITPAARDMGEAEEVFARA